MAKEDTEVVAFQTTSDEACLIPKPGEDEVPAVIVNPAASSTELWTMAEGRLVNLRHLLGILSTTEGCGVVYTIADFAEVILPRVQEILILAEEANMRTRSGR